MLRRRRLDLAVLSLVAASLFGGSGVGCKPGSTASSFSPQPPDAGNLTFATWRSGKREPGNAWLILPYALTPPLA
jgi:hypothetical protein